MSMNLYRTLRHSRPGLVVAAMVLGLCWTAHAAQASDAAKCPQVACDCAALPEGTWRDLCVNRELQAKQECAANQGVPKSYCGLHGPKGTPVAVSLPERQSVAAPDDLKIAEQLAATQAWTLTDSLRLVKEREAAGNFAEAVQVMTLSEREALRLFELHHQVLVGMQQAGRGDAARDLIARYADETLQRARNIQAYGDQLWQNVGAASNAREKRAYTALSLKTGRFAAAVYEYSADLYASVGANEMAAPVWQVAAELARGLAQWEAETENKTAHIAFYQAQSAARWHRATYAWLQAERAERGLASLERANRVEQGETAIAESRTDSALEEVGTQELRAIRRGGGR